MRPSAKKKIESRQKRIAKERIEILFKEAEKTFSENPELSDQFIELARRIAKKLNTGMPRRLRMRFCRNCGAFLVPGENSTIRLNSEKGNIVITCHKCGQVKRYPYKGPKDKN